MKPDISQQSDIKKLVDGFYLKVNKNPVLSPIFNKIAKIDWDTHLPRMYDFWAGILFGETNFKGNPMQKHILLSQHAPMGNKEFTIWLDLFKETVDEFFEGPNAQLAKERAFNIAHLMQFKIQSHHLKTDKSLLK